MIYICSDSFGVSDPDYGSCWTDILAERFPVTNLSQVAATNLLIAQQVDQALSAQAKFIILQCTAVTRAEKREKGQIIPFSYHTASRVTTPFDDRQLSILKKYFTEFFDLDLAIYQNKIIIEHTLQKILDSGTPFIFDQGGFEHQSFDRASQGYFAKFLRYRSDMNLWDHASDKKYRPYFHITDLQVHQRVADYYSQAIDQALGPQHDQAQ